MSAGEIFDDINNTLKMAQQEQASINIFITSMEAHAKKIITEIYGDGLLTMESEGFREIDENISRSLYTISLDICNIISKHQCV